MSVAIPQKKKRSFLPQELKIDSWSVLEPFFKDLNERSIGSLAELKTWMHHRDELECILSEELAWRYIHMNCDTTAKDLMDSFNFFVTEIEPNIAPYTNSFNKKLIACPFTTELKGDAYFIYLRNIRKSLELFREENISLLSQLQVEQQVYGTISAAMTVEHDGKEFTLQQASVFLENTDRNLRETIFKKIASRRLQDSMKLNELLDSLIVKRQKVAKNANYNNFRDYMFDALGRFDYTLQDCLNFHDAIRQHIVPMMENYDENRRIALNLDKLKPWDKDVDITGKPALKPHTSANDLIDKSIECFKKIKPQYGEYIAVMRQLGFLDLDSRKGKAPGGFNYPLQETGLPFIYMNSAGVLRDVVTMVHEGGHAIHTFVTRDLELGDFKSTPSEVAELASMSMELISMEHWDAFLSDADDLRRAKKEQLEKVLRVLPWIAAVDKFQHWLYENEGHTHEQRKAAWLNIMNDFSAKTTDWSDDAETLANKWQGQLHIYEVPFYYIEYGMAQLGAIAVWRNYKQNPEKAIEQYENALRLGYTKSIGEIYKAAGVQFDFSEAYVKELATFVKAELEKL